MGSLCEAAAALMLEAGTLAGYNASASVEHAAPLATVASAAPKRHQDCELSTSVNGVRSRVAVVVLSKAEFRDRFLNANSLADDAAADDLVAYYSNSLKTIFLPEGFSAEDAANRSDLLHELVHHEQDVADPGLDRFERERRAYAAQIAYLDKVGRNREADFLKIIMLMQGTDPAKLDYGGQPATGSAARR